jgi:hypothetical protein
MHINKVSFIFIDSEKYISMTLFSGQPALSYDGTMHYSFDYAQQIHYPHYSQQVGPLFFKTLRKCQCFGVCAEGSGMYIHLYTV